MAVQEASFGAQAGAYSFDCGCKLSAARTCRAAALGGDSRRRKISDAPLAFGLVAKELHSVSCRHLSMAAFEFQVRRGPLI